MRLVFEERQHRKPRSLRRQQLRANGRAGILAQKHQDQIALLHRRHGSRSLLPRAWRPRDLPGEKHGKARQGLADHFPLGLKIRRSADEDPNGLSLTHTSRWLTRSDFAPLASVLYAREVNSETPNLIPALLPPRLGCGGCSPKPRNRG